MLGRGWFLMISAVVPCCVSHKLQLQHEVTWARDVLLGSEVGDGRPGVVRWPHPIHFLLVAAPERVQLAVASAFDQLQEALAGVQRLKLEYVDERDPRIGQDHFITMFATAPDHAGLLAERHGAQPPDVLADGWFTIIWNLQYELTRAIVFVDPELEQARLRHTALEEMFQVLGPSNDSGRIRDSLVFERGFSVGGRTSLATVDAKVLVLLYEDLSPGDNAADIERAMRRSW